MVHILLRLLWSKVANKNASNVATVLDYHSTGKKHPVFDDDKDASRTVKKNKISEEDKTNSSKPLIAHRSVKDTGEKLKILAWHFKNGKTQAQTADHFNITQSSLSRWIKDSETLAEVVKANGSSVKR